MDFNKKNFKNKKKTYKKDKLCQEIGFIPRSVNLAVP